MKLFDDKEIGLLEALAKFDKPGALTAEEIDVLKSYNSTNRIQHIPFALLRKAKSAIALSEINRMYSGASGTMIRLDELKKSFNLLAFSSELDALEELIDRTTITVYLMWKVLRNKGIVNDEDLIKASEVSLEDVAEMNNMEALANGRDQETSGTDSGPVHGEGREAREDSGDDS